ncbi:MAG: DUF1858 domain-containing protein [Erysipelothrix sp.]|nr:DUF1858 domain-containing protein [Erysipelothrix sp.]
MKKININDTFYNITNKEPELKQTFIDLGFTPMSSIQTYNTVGRVITLKKALDHIKMSVSDVNKILSEKGLDFEVYE